MPILRCYLEITNHCNLSCKFCPKTARAPRRMQMSEFDIITEKLRGKVKFLYLHLMGEPLTHTDLPIFVKMAREKGLVPIVTTNGTLLNTKVASNLLQSKPYKIQISIHSQEGNGFSSHSQYISHVMQFAMQAAQSGTICVLRLWNSGGYNSDNQEIMNLMEEYIPGPWTMRHDGYKIANNIFLEYDKMFQWPDEMHEDFTDNNVFCYALRNQVGVLVDGSVVPCCLDHEGDITLGNLYNNSLEEILSSPRAKAIYDGFTNHHATEPLCRKCGYANKTKMYRE